MQVQKYLGLPNMVGKKKSAALGYLKDCLRERIQGWEKKNLSKGVKEVLIKTVAQALPNYAMSMFLLPQQLCADMDNMLNKFWWRGSKHSRGIHWLSWERMCSNKSVGGLGFRKLQYFNKALLGKQGWRLIVNMDSLASKVYKERYYPNGSFLQATVGNNPSYIWRSIMESQVLLKKGAVRRVGKGTTIDILNDHWLPGHDTYVQTVHDA